MIFPILITTVKTLNSMFGDVDEIYRGAKISYRKYNEDARLVSISIHSPRWQAISGIENGFRAFR